MFVFIYKHISQKGACMKNTHNFAKIEGRYINLREAEVSDSAFILSLRTDSKKSKYIHKTPNDLQKQIEYMQHYKAQDDEWYFIVEDKQGKSLGTNRIGRYPLWDSSFLEKDGMGVLSPASWLMADFANPLESLESDLLIKDFFFENFPYKIAVQTIHKDNVRVLKYHQSWGSKIIGYYEPQEHYLLHLMKGDFYTYKDKFSRMLYKNKEQK